MAHRFGPDGRVANVSLLALGRFDERGLSEVANDQTTWSLVGIEMI